MSACFTAAFQLIFLIIVTDLFNNISSLKGRDKKYNDANQWKSSVCYTNAK